MDKPKHNISILSDKYPSGLKTAEEISEDIQNISAARILELAKAGYMPHYLCDGSNYMFRAVEVREWLANNLIVKSCGSPFPKAIRVVVPASEIVDKPPSSISNIQNLQQIPKWGFNPGVYFLCHLGEVVYVGQSIAPSSRIGSHANCPTKNFDRVYLLSVPESELDNTEAAFIKHLAPSQQGGIRNGKGAVSPKITRPIAQTLLSYGVSI